MTERPLILPGWAVRAVLREIEAPGTGKSQHRVVLKNLTRDRDGVRWRLGAKYHGVIFACDNDVRSGAVDWPRYLPVVYADRLWTRETWRLNAMVSGGSERGPAGCLYQADGDHVVLDDGYGFTACRRDGSERSPWRSSAIMPRWASRLTLLVTDVRVQRVQDITEEDARAEGVAYEVAVCRGADEALRNEPSYRGGYANRWAAQHGPDAWVRNDWVLALTFRPIPRNIDMEA